MNLRKFRTLNKIYAFIFGYFWLPCRICGQNFGGHECGPAIIWTSEYGGYITCYKHSEKESINAYGRDMGSISTGGERNES